jgi:hypothetical protein
MGSGRAVITGEDGLHPLEDDLIKLMKEGEFLGSPPGAILIEDDIVLTAVTIMVSIEVRELYPLKCGTPISIEPVKLAKNNHCKRTRLHLHFDCRVNLYQSNSQPEGEAHGYFTTAQSLSQDQQKS